MPRDFCSPSETWAGCGRFCRDCRTGETVLKDDIEGVMYPLTESIDSLRRRISFCKMASLLPAGENNLLGV